MHFNTFLTDDPSGANIVRGDILDLDQICEFPSLQSKSESVNVTCRRTGSTCECPTELMYVLPCVGEVKAVIMV